MEGSAELIGSFLIFKARIFHVPFSPKIQPVLGDTTPKMNASMPFNTAQAPSSGSEPSLQRSSRRSFEAASTPSEKMVPWVTHPGCLELSCFNYTGPQPTTYLPQAFDSSILKLQPGTSNIDEHPPCPWFSCTHRGNLQGKVWFHLLSTSWRHLVVLINQEMTRFELAKSLGSHTVSSCQRCLSSSRPTSPPKERYFRDPLLGQGPNRNRRGLADGVLHWRRACHGCKLTPSMVMGWNFDADKSTGS